MRKLVQTRCFCYLHWAKVKKIDRSHKELCFHTPLLDLLQSHDPYQRVIEGLLVKMLESLKQEREVPRFLTVCNFV